MKILVLHRYFWPQAYPYAQMLKDISEILSTNNEVSVLTTNSGNKQEKQFRSKWSESKDIKIRSLPLGAEKQASLLKKAANSIFFGVWVLYQLLTTKVDVVMVATTPPVIIAMIVRWVSSLRGYKYVYHCQDIHPEGMLYGLNISNGLKYKFLLQIDKKNINTAWKVITLSEDMKHTLDLRGCKTSHVSVINNFIFESGDKPDDSPLKKNQLHKKDYLHFLFAGTLGRLQNLDVLMECLALLKHREDIFFTFMGDGVMSNQMKLYKEENKLDNVRFLGQRSFLEAVSAMQEADAGIVSVGKNIASVAYPSKTMMYLGNGLPVLALVDSGTELFNFINHNKVGRSIAPSSALAIAKSIEIFADELKSHPIERNHVKNIAEKHFSRNNILPKFLDIYK